jgi:DNA-binding CsgD family transcriptional regulator
MNGRERREIHAGVREMMAESGKIGESSQLRRHSLQDDTFALVPFQLEGHTYWVVPACHSDAQRGYGKERSSIEYGGRSICGWLRADDRTYFVVTQSDDVTGEPDHSVAKDAPWETLSERETQIAVLVSHGKGTKQIAGHLLISEHTVRSYMRRIFSKLHVSTRPAMVAELMRLGFIAPDFGGPRPKR